MKIYAEITGEKMSFKNKFEDLEKVLVKIELFEGSLGFDVPLDKPLTEMAKHMTGTQSAITICLVAAMLCGGWYFKTDAERASAAAEMRLREKESEASATAIRDLIEAQNKATEALSKSNTALVNLLAKTGSDDEVKTRVDGKERIIPANEAKANIPVYSEYTPDMIYRSFQVWGDFTFTRLDSDKFVFVMSAPGIPTIKDAVTSFSTAEERKAFFESYSSFLAKEETPELKVLLSIVVDESKTISGVRILKVLDAEPENVEHIAEVVN